MKYLLSLINLLPKGKAWSTESNTNLYKLLNGLSLEFERVEKRKDQLLKESDPRTATETIEDWERVFGLPDDCDKESNDFSIERRLKLVNRKISFRGGQSPSYFQNYIKALGFEAEVVENHEFRAGMATAGNALSNGIEWINTFYIKVPKTFSYEFSAGISTAGEPLRVFRNASVECSINHIKPAHSKVIFIYS